MSLYRSGRLDAARAKLRRLRVTIEEERYANDQMARRVFAEANASIPAE